MDKKAQQERYDLLVELGEEVHSELSAIHADEGGDSREIVFSSQVVPKIIEDYVQHLSAFKEFHDFPYDKRADADKIAALTAILIMRHWPFISETGEVNTKAAASANEIYALRFASVALGIEFIPPVYYRWLYHCLSHAIEDDSAMHTWVVLAMKVLRWQIGCDAETALKGKSA